MVYAIKTKVLRDNPFAGIECYKLGTYHTWTEAEIAQFERHGRSAPVRAHQRGARAVVVGRVVHAYWPDGTAFRCGV
jgi:hypothetical protein